MQRWSEQLEGLRFSTPVIAIYAVASFTGALIAFSASGKGFALIVGIAGLVTGAAVGILLLLRLFVSGTSDVHVVVFLLLSLSVGVVRGVLMVAVALPAELIPRGNATSQILNSGVSAVVWFFLAGLLFSSRERYRRKYRSLLIQGAAEGDSRSVVDTDWDHNPAIISMKENMAVHMGEFGAVPSVESLTKTAEAIRIQIEHNLRPLSHRLWFGSFAEYPHVRISRLIRDSVTYFRMPVWAISLTWFLGGIVGGPMLFGLMRGILATISSTAVLVGLLLIFRSFAARRPSLFLGTMYVLVAATAPLMAADVVLLAVGFPSDFSVGSGLVVFLPAALAAIMLLGLAISLANSDRDAILAVAQGYAAKTGAGAASALEASTYLHNTLQSELTGVALQLGRAAQSMDAEDSRKAMMRAHEILNRSLTQDYVAKSIDPLTHAERFAQAWRGICTVRIQMTDDVARDARVAVAIQAAEELVTNAVRHSGATNVEIQLGLIADGMQLTCRIDRTWVETDRIGLGSHWFATVSPRGLGIEQGSGWTQLRLVIE
jgi:hypothetical protein